MAKVAEVGGLASWLLAAHAARRDSVDAGQAACLLLTAPPAAGKTCLMSQLIMDVLKSEECDLVPILIKVQELQRHLFVESNRSIFERSWNWFDAFLQCVHGAGSDMYYMLRQALMARRALVLLDGIDEGDKARDAIERHVTEVLAPQGHVMLVTSHPAGLLEERFNHHFEHVQLEPLSEAQQEEVIAKRLGKGEHSELLEYLRDPKRVPLDNATQQRVTGNLVMLSMVISIFRSKQGTESTMPATITELYETASKAMLERVDRKERGAAASAATMPHLTSLLEATFFEAHAAEVRDFGNEVLDRAACSLRCDCDVLPADTEEALRVVRERVVQDRLPLLSLLEAEPLQMRSSHLSFQEYFAVRAICTGKHRLPCNSPPWKWGPFWANVVRLGSENGTEFGNGLLRAAGMEGDELSLSGKLGGDSLTVLGVVCAFLISLRVLDLSFNELGPRGGVAVADTLKVSGSLAKCNVRNNQLDVESARLLSKIASEKHVMLFGIKHDQEKADFGYERLRPVDAILVASDLAVSGSLTSLNLMGNNIGDKGGVAIAEALKVNGSLTSLDLRLNKNISQETKKMLKDAAHARLQLSIR